MPTNNTTPKLEEGLTRNALQHLVLPLLSIDEYQSKISDKRVIVVAFFVKEEDAAIDLSNFIDQSHYPILDTEVSPSPNPEGFYLVFVELQRNDDFPENLMSVIKEIENLVEIKSWDFDCSKEDGPFELTTANLKDHLVLDQDQIIDVPGDLDNQDEEDQDEEDQDQSPGKEPNSNNTK